MTQSIEPIYTTHLICAPELDNSGAMVTLLVQAGERVRIDTPLVRLVGQDWQMEVCAPATGLIGEIAVTEGSDIESNDLLLTMEIEELPFNFLPILEDEPAFAPACQLPYAPVTPIRGKAPLRIMPEAASLAARLGVDLAEVKPDAEDIVDEEAIAAHVRDILVRWRKIRRLLLD